MLWGGGAKDKVGVRAGSVTSAVNCTGARLFNGIPWATEPFTMRFLEESFWDFYINHNIQKQ